MENATGQVNWKVESESFDSVAELYDIYRPGYPSDLIDDIISLTGIGPEGKLLEIGCGTGKATTLFAEHGFDIFCLEPGKNMIRVAADNLKSYPRVTYFQSRFEDWENDQGLFDLVISAQAYHWVPEDVRYEKTASVLKQDGFLAAFWNMYPRQGGEIGQELACAYSRHSPELSKPEINPAPIIESRAESLIECTYFDDVIVKTYPWAGRYDTKEYLGLLNTYSDHLCLSLQKREDLFNAVEEVIERNGGVIIKPYLAVLYLARKI